MTETRMQLIAPLLLLLSACGATERVAGGINVDAQSSVRSSAADSVQCFSLILEGGGALSGIFRDVVLLDTVRTNPNQSSTNAVRHLRNVTVDSSGVPRVVVRRPWGIMVLEGGISFPPEPGWYRIARDSVVLFYNMGFANGEVRLRLFADRARGKIIEGTDLVDPANLPQWRSVIGNRVACPDVRTK